MSLIENRRVKLVDRLKGYLKHSDEFILASAYVSPGACERLRLLSLAERVSIKVVVGRASEEGLPWPTKNYLRSLHSVASRRDGGVRVMVGAGFHSKIYCGSAVAIAGSSNLTDHGLDSWREANWEFSDAESVLHLREEALSLYDAGVDFDSIFDEIKSVSARRIRSKGGDYSVILPTDPGAGTPGIEISLLSRGEVPAKSGLNWGHAGGRTRDPYECYVRYPKLTLADGAYVFGSSDRGTIVTALTHDGKEFSLRLQGTASGTLAKQISTAGNNSALGYWIRGCLKLPANHVVTRADLEAYGRTSISFYRVGTEQDGRPIVYMDFSV